MLMSWKPPVSGRYVAGNKDSPVAICTMASVDIELPMDDIAISGKLVTENIGIEKVVKNVIANPNIRFIVCCGRPSKGHFVDDALECLVKNGVDKDGRIVGAKGAMAAVKNLTKEEIEHFRKQVEVVCISGEKDVEKIMAKVKECVARNPGPFGSSIVSKGIEDVVATHDESEVVLDELGFFTIHLRVKEKQIVCEHYTKNKKLHCRVVGKTAEEVCATVVRFGLLSKLDHAAYLGRELQKAEIALKNNLDYEDQKELKLKG